MTKRALRVIGDTQAEAVALVIGRLPEISDDYTVAFERGTSGDINALVANGKTVTFAVLRLEMSWPMTCANTRDRVEPGFPFGEFPYGDKFVSACLDKKVPPEQILRLATSGTWGSNWPDLDETFAAESRRLTAGDAACDVKIGAHVLKRFRSQRLFWTVDHPADVLIAELVRRLLTASGLVKNPTKAVDEHFTPAEEGGLLGIYAVPVHPHVASHFALAWYRPDQTYQVYDRLFSYETYYEALIASAAATATASAG